MSREDTWTSVEVPKGPKVDVSIYKAPGTNDITYAVSVWVNGVEVYAYLVRGSAPPPGMST